MFLEIRLLFKKYDVTLWVKELLNVRDNNLVLSPIHMEYNKPKSFTFGSILQKVVH